MKIKMPRKFKLIPGIYIVIMLFCLCSFARAEDNLFVSSELGFSLNLPATWRQEGAIDRANDVALIKFIGEQGLALITVTKGPAFDNFKEYVISELTQNGTKPSPSLEEFTLNGIACIKTVVPVTQSDLGVSLPAGFDNIRVLTYFVNSSKAGYMITATPVFPKDFDGKKPLFEQIISSFQVLP